MPTGKAIVHWIGCINAIKMIFGKKWQMTAYILWVKNLSKSLYLTQFLRLFAFCAEIKHGKRIFGEKVADHSAYILQVENFIEIALAKPFLEINAFLHVTHSRWLPKMAGKQLLGKVAEDSV